jgi:hypothetical protein
MDTISCTNLSDERRRRRSDDPLVAMRFQLEQVMADFTLKACVLATDEGLLLVAPRAVDEDDAEVLAAMGTMQRTEDGSFVNQTLVQTCLQGMTIADGDQNVFAQEFWAWDQPWTLVALGTLSRAQELSVMRAIMGIRRIARQNAPFKASA